MPSGHTFTLHRQTDITIDVIGATARRYPLLTAVTETETAAQAPPLQITTGTVELPSIRVGTAPVTFVTGVPEGLLAAVLEHAGRGGPAGLGEAGVDRAPTTVTDSDVTTHRRQPRDGHPQD
jgi:hypothetical protein